VGVLDHDLAAAARRALTIPGADCRAYAERFSWDSVARQFVGMLAVDLCRAGLHTAYP
jgi:hypothetical protein